tara:strand:+ start:1332 stop:1700 length:369 start_codon:yes stop_codon:yes gene_type:complete
MSKFIQTNILKEWLEKELDKPRSSACCLMKAEYFIRCLYKSGLLYHFDDDPFDCLKNTHASVNLIDMIQKYVNHILFDASIKWSEDHLDPFGYALEISSEDDNTSWFGDSKIYRQMEAEGLK